MSKTITQLTAASEPAGPELAECVQSGVSKKFTPGIPKHALVAGGAAGDITVAAIKVGDRLDEVIHYIFTAGTDITNITDLTAEFSITADGKINNTGGTASTNNKLLVRWTKRTA